MMLREGDILLLCSDGLTDVVRDEEINVVLRSYDAGEAARELVNLANQRGGPDNVTVVVVHYGKVALAAPQRPYRRGVGRLIAVAGAALVLVAVAFLAMQRLGGMGAAPSVVPNTPHDPGNVDGVRIRSLFNS